MTNTDPTADAPKETANTGAPVPREFVWAITLAAGFMAFTAWDQSHWWRVKQDYTFGWLVPFFVVYVVYDRWPVIASRLRDALCGPPSARWVRWTLNAAAVLGMVFGALFFLLGSFYRAGAGTSQPGTLAITLGMVCVVLPLLFFNVPVGGPSATGGRETPVGRTGAKGVAALWSDRRFRVASLFVFPALVWLVSAPIVSVLESQISLFLLRKVVAVVAFVFDTLGLPLEQRGNVLVLPEVTPGVPNQVGVAEACSGIRSLTACLFAGSFLGAVFMDRLWKKVVLVAASMVFAFVMNLGRGLFLTSWAYNNGHEAIEGAVHDVAGYAVLGATCLGLFALMPLLNLKVRIGRVVDTVDRPQAPTG